MKQLYDGGFDGTADIESYDNDTPADNTSWCAPVLVVNIALAFAAGWVSAIWLMLP